MTITLLTDPNLTLPPTQDELPYDDGVPMESARHKAQMDLLIDPIIPWLAKRGDGYVGGNMFIYFSMAQLKNEDFRGPDFFAVLGVSQEERKSWVVWEEGKGPDVVIELLSDSTAQVDKYEKKLIYQNQLRVPEYFWFDPFNAQDLAGFHLQDGIYQPIVANAENQLVSQVLGLALELWEGHYEGIESTWLRWVTLEGELVPTLEEQERHRAEQERHRAERERHRAEQERHRAEQERHRAEQAESKLQQTARNLLQEGMSVEKVSQLTGLSVAKIAELS